MQCSFSMLAKKTDAGYEPFYKKNIQTISNKKKRKRNADNTKSQSRRKPAQYKLNSDNLNYLNERPKKVVVYEKGSEEQKMLFRLLDLTHQTDNPKAWNTSFFAYGKNSARHSLVYEDKIERELGNLLSKKFRCYLNGENGKTYRVAFSLEKQDKKSFVKFFPLLEPSPDSETVAPRFDFDGNFRTTEVRYVRIVFWIDSDDDEDKKPGQTWVKSTSMKEAFKRATTLKEEEENPFPSKRKKSYIAYDITVPQKPAAKFFVFAVDDNDKVVAIPVTKFQPWVFNRSFLPAPKLPKSTPPEPVISCSSSSELEEESPLRIRSDNELDTTDEE